MKKILLVMSVAIFIALCSAPSLVKADTYVIGSAYIKINSGTYAGDYNLPIYTTVSVSPKYVNIRSGNIYVYPDSSFTTRYQVYYNAPWNNNNQTALYQDVLSGYIEGLVETYNWTYNNVSRNFYGVLSDYIESLPEDLRPDEPSIAEQKWLDFYDWFYDVFGYYPREGSLIDLIRLLAIGDWTDTEEITIVYPTITPAPPTPTPIPVQTIFVPDGNGNTTIIYQYTDPTTGVITQSPYNPNIDIDVNCDCNGGSSGNTFGTDPTDPTALTSSMLWADGFGVEITDNPLTAANDSQKSLAEAAAEYSDSVNVVSNSFNVLPSKWLMLVGLLGGILIIAGLLKTFLGG